MSTLSSHPLKVRFAPSPTGYLHIGNIRTALINWLFAKKNGGHFLLRMDDTDLERSKPEYELAIIENLEWLGLTHDSFFKQSDRFDRYKEVMDKLIAAGRLYPCYETPEELEFKRKRQLGRGEPPRYDRAALKLTIEEKQALEAQGLKPHYRFLLEDKDVSWHDLSRGDVYFGPGTLSDPVLVRADGAYLYTLTSVVDDVDFEVTHILRGEDHVTNTAVQVQLFEALGRVSGTITFSHTTLLMDKDGSGLSKRIGSLSVGEMRAQGLEPMAICSLLARLGTSLPVQPVLTMDELASHFDLGTFSRNAPRFDLDELKEMNH
ncbi:MAG: glutamate--tRNA ligase, partial [Alphaproteobacteria bacterium]|nr:glutamate--tRNA ligase [Alphaproteobacteria bacterium]